MKCRRVASAHFVRSNAATNTGILCRLGPQPTPPRDPSPLKQLHIFRVICGPSKFISVHVGASLILGLSWAYSRLVLSLSSWEPAFLSVHLGFSLILTLSWAYPHMSLRTLRILPYPGLMLGLSQAYPELILLGTPHFSPYT